MKCSDKEWQHCQKEKRGCEGCAYNDEISVGEYVRTKLGDIKKITKGFEFIIERHNKSDNKIVKHSKEIIDLIEQGDYVNGYKVLYVCNEEPCPSGKYVDIDCNKPSEESYFFENEIKSIITKEQIKQIEYRIKE